MKAAIHSVVLKVTDDLPLAMSLFYVQFGHTLQLFGKSKPRTRLGCKEANWIGWYYVTMIFDI